MRISDTQKATIREQVLRAIALNRQPGYHFCGNFLEMVLHHNHDGHSTVDMAVAPGIVDLAGCVSPTALSVVADFALANAVRSASNPAARLATVSLNLQFNGPPLAGDIRAEGTLEAFFHEGQGRLGLSRAKIWAADVPVGFATSTFMVLPAPAGTTLHPIPWINHPAPAIDLPEIGALSAEEQWIYQRAEDALARMANEDIDFLSAFFDMDAHVNEQGAVATLKNGPHVGNRVGHVQGGITLGLAISGANAALPGPWKMTGISASFVSPGEGDVLTSHATVVHRGRLTAVVHNRVFGVDGRIVLEAISNHTRVVTALEPGKA